MITQVDHAEIFSVLVQNHARSVLARIADDAARKCECSWKFLGYREIVAIRRELKSGIVLSRKKTKFNVQYRTCGWSRRRCVFQRHKVIPNRVATCFDFQA